MGADGFLDAIAGISGKTSYEVWQSGNDWSTIVKNAEALLGKQSKWNVLTDEAGNAFQIIGKNGKYINVASAAGEAEQYIAGNQLVTDLVVEESGSLTAYTGNMLNEAGEVTKKGLALGATTGAKVAMGALGAFGAVATGVQWYKDNPQFWTDVSQKLLPWAYKDPTNKKWSDIFYEALVPTAVDDSGTTYVQANMLQDMYGFLNQQGFFRATLTSTFKEDAKVPEVLKGRSFPLTRELFEAYPWRSAWHNTKLTTEYDEVYMFRIGHTDGSNVAYISGPFTVDTSSLTTRTYKDNKNDLDNGYPLGYFIGDGTEKSFNRYAQYYRYGDGEYLFAVTSTTNTSNQRISEEVFIPEIAWYDRDTFHAITENRNDFLFYLWHGNIEDKPKLQLENVNVPDNLPYGDYLPSVYPDWYKNAITSVNPNFKPSEPDSAENPKYITWLPLQFPDDVTGDGGSTVPDSTPEQVQGGKPLPDDTTTPDTNKAVDDGILPNPYPNPEAEPSTGNTPSTPTPTPEQPDPESNLPFISGGTANALWKIYNPSTEILQSFGAWLWSSDPIKMIREIFNNNPADGIIGLHMIYVTPPTGGSSNIIVGYVDSGVSSPFVSQQYVDVDCGSVTIPLRYQSALDFGYTKVYCYLPFIGIVPLDSYDIVGKTVHIKYTVDVLTGTVLAQISVSGDGFSAVLYTFNGSCSVEYPLTAGTRSSQMLSLITGAVGGAAIGGLGGAVLGGLRGAATGADVRASGNLAGNAGAMGIRKPYIIVKRPVEVAARNYNAFYGYPANITGKLSSFSGYTRVKDVHVDDISGATTEEKKEIEQLLTTGVIIN